MWTNTRPWVPWGRCRPPLHPESPLHSLFDLGQITSLRHLTCNAEILMHAKETSCNRVQHVVGAHLMSTLTDDGDEEEQDAL